MSPVARAPHPRPGHRSPLRPVRHLEAIDHPGGSARDSFLLLRGFPAMRMVQRTGRIFAVRQL